MRVTGLPSLLRIQLTRQLRLELGHESVRQAGELVRNYVAEADQQSATVDRFLDELDDMAPAAAEVVTNERREIFGTKFMMPSLTRSPRCGSPRALAGRCRIDRCW